MHKRGFHRYPLLNNYYHYYRSYATCPSRCEPFKGSPGTYATCCKGAPDKPAAAAKAPSVSVPTPAAVKTSSSGSPRPKKVKKTRSAGNNSSCNAECQKCRKETPKQFWADCDPYTGPTKPDESNKPKHNRPFRLAPGPTHEEPEATPPLKEQAKQIRGEGYIVGLLDARTIKKNRDKCKKKHVPVDSPACAAIIGGKPYPFTDLTAPGNLYFNRQSGASAQQLKNADDKGVHVAPSDNTRAPNDPNSDYYVFGV